MNTRPISLLPKSLQLIVICSLFSVIACSGSQDQISTVDCTGVTPTYTADIKTILNASCAKVGCHDAYYAQRGIDLSSYGNASDVSRTSSFLGCIQHVKGYNPMPQGAAKLSADKIQLLTCWVQNGSPQ
jgi:hypothetical protein